MRKQLIIILSVLLLNTFAFSNNEDEGAFEARYYDDARVLRVKYAQGETYVQRSYDEGFEEAAVNLPIFEKDRVGTTEGRVEIYLGRLNYLRLDYDTEVEFDRVPELRKTDVTFRMKKGGVYLDIENLDHERDIEVQTPDCGIFILDKGVYRINVNEDGETELYVYEGIAEVSGEHDSRNVRENQKIVMYNGRVREHPYYFYASDTDGFDRWNQERNGVVGYARYNTSRYLASGYEDYEYELSRHGRWVYNTSYSEYIWIPYNIGMSWSPYYHGRWIWTPFYGYTWVSYDPWGYFTHHYGRWHWDAYYGWHWYPGYHWSPAWVYWFWDSSYYGWCPLSRWNRPVIIINNRWLRNHNHRRGIPIHSRAAVIIKKHQLGAAHINKVALKKNVLAKKSIAAKGFAPKVKPNLDKVRIVNARGKTVAYKKSGFLNTKKYKTAKGSVYKHPGSETKDKSVTKRVFKYSKGSKAGKKTSSKEYKGYTVSEIKKKTSSKGSSYKYKSSSKSKSTKTYRSPKTSKSGSKYKSRSTKSSSTKSRSSGSKSKASSRSSSSGKSQKIKKKSKEPSYYSSKSYKPSSSSSYKSRNYSSSSKSSYGTYKKSASKKKSYTSSYKSYKPSYKSGSSYKSSSPSSSKRKSYSSSYKSGSYTSKSYTSSKPSYSSRSYRSSSSSSSRQSYSTPSSKYRSSYKSSSRSGSYSKPRSYSGSSRSYSRSSSSRSSSSRSSSSRSSSRSSRSARKK